MNRNELEVAAEERLFDAMLDEVGRETDVLVRRVASPKSRWFAAALVLLGLAVVAGVVMTSRAMPAVAVAPQEPAPLPPVVEVRGIAALRQADRQVENLSCAIEGPDFGVLQEFVRLRALRVEQDYNLPHPLLVQSAWSLAPVARCTKLESLSVGPLARFTAVELAPIAVVPNLCAIELSGVEKDVDAAFAAVLAKLPLRSLVLQGVQLLPEGLRLLGELPLLERLELRDCHGLEKCDLKHLYRLRQLRSLTLRGVGRETRLISGLGRDDPGPIQFPLPQVRDGSVLAITGEWTRGLAGALPKLRELDLAESRIDGGVFASLPRGLTFLGVQGVVCHGDPGIAAIGDLPQLQGFSCGEVQRMHPLTADAVPFAAWVPMLEQKKLHRFEFSGIPTRELLDVLRQQAELQQLRLAIGLAIVTTNDLGQVMLGGVTPLDFGFLGDLPRLERVSVVRPSQSIEKAIRRAVGDRVRVETLPR